MKQDRKNADTLFESLNLNLPAMAQVIKKKGRGRDTVLAHITPDEAKLLKKRGGRGSINPDTGLLEFEDYYSEFSPASYMAGADYQAPSYQAAPDFTPQTGMSDSYTGGGYVPEGYTPSYTEGRPEISAPSYQGGVDLGSYQGPGITNMGGAQPTGVQLPQVQDLGVGSLGARGAVPSGVPDTFGAPSAGAAPTAETQDTQSIMDKIEKATGMNKETLARLGIGVLQAGGGVAATTRAAKQGQQAKKEQQGIAAPYQQRGAELVGKAERGELTPVGQQELEAARARLAQGVEGRGGVGAAQIQTQIESFRQQLLQGQYDLGLKISGIGDQIALGAIKTGMEADRYVNELANSYFTNIARTIYGQAAPPKTITINQ